MAFDVRRALQEGYNYSEIAEYLASKRKFNLVGARNEGYSDEEIVKHLSFEPTIGGQLKEAVKGVVPGAIGLVEQAAVGASALLPDQYEAGAQEAIRGVAAAAKKPFAPEAGYEESVGRKFGEAAGSFVPFLGLGALGVAGRVGAGALATGSGAGEALTRAQQEGATEGQKSLSTGLGAVVGLSELITPFRILSRIPEGEVLTAANRIKRVALAGGEEAAQEAAAGLAQNLIARGVYKPEQQLIEGLGEQAAYGGAVGALAQGLLDVALGRRAKTAATPAQPTQPTTPAVEEQPAAPAAPAAPTTFAPARGVPETATQQDLFTEENIQRTAQSTREAQDRLFKLRDEFDLYQRENERLAAAYERETDPTKKQQIYDQAVALAKPLNELKTQIEAVKSTLGAAESARPGTGEPQLDFEAPLPSIGDRVGQVAKTEYRPDTGTVIGEKAAAPRLDEQQQRMLEEQRVQGIRDKIAAGEPVTQADMMRVKFLERDQYQEEAAKPTPALDLSQQKVTRFPLTLQRTDIEQPKMKVQEQPAAPETRPVTEQDFRTMGIGATNKKLREEILGKDLANPEDRKFVKERLEAYASNPNRSPAITQKVNSFLENSIFLEQMELPLAPRRDEDVKQPEQPIAGASEPSVSVPDQGAAVAAPGSEAPVATGVGEPALRTEPRDVAEGKQPRPLTEIQQRAAFGKGIGATYEEQLRTRQNPQAGKAVQQGSFSGVLDALEKSKNPVVQQVAKLARNLKTKIEVSEDAFETFKDETYTSRQRSIDYAKMHLGALDYIRQVAPQIEKLPDGAALPDEVLGRNIQAYEDGEATSKYGLRTIVDNNNSMFALLGLQDGAKLRTKEDFLNLRDAIERVTKNIGENAIRLTSTAVAFPQMGVGGLYDVGSDTIKVSDYKSKDEHVLAHEIVHAQVANIVANPKPAQRPTVQRLNKLYEHVKQHYKKEAATEDPDFYRPPYGVSSIQEFIAEGISDPRFQYELSRIKYQNTTAWDKFTEYIAKLLGLKNDNALTELLTIYGELTQPGVKAKTKGQGKLFMGAEKGQPQELTPEFKKWFGDSKVVDKNGEPLVLYRGVQGNKEGAINAEPREGYNVFVSDSPDVAASYGMPDETHGIPGSIVPIYVKADKLIEFPVTVDRYGFRSFDKIGFDRRARSLAPGEVLVARQVVDIGPMASEAYRVDKEKKYSHYSDIYALGRGTPVKSAIGNVGKAKTKGQGKLFMGAEGAVSDLFKKDDKGRFESDIGNVSESPDYKDRTRLIYLPIDTFLKLAKPTDFSKEDVNILTGNPKLKTVNNTLDRGEQLNTIPFLTIREGENGVYEVTGHEGRHRAFALSQRGYTHVPVAVRSSNIRWDQQSDPGKFDYIEIWPTELLSEDGKAKVPFPISREQSAEPAVDPTNNLPDQLFFRQTPAPILTIAGQQAQAAVAAMAGITNAKPKGPQMSTLQKVGAFFQDPSYRQNQIDKFRVQVAYKGAAAESKLAMLNQYNGKIRDALGNIRPDVFMTAAEHADTMAVAVMKDGKLKLDPKVGWVAEKGTASFQGVIDKIKELGTKLGDQQLAFKLANDAFIARRANYFKQHPQLGISGLPDDAKIKAGMQAFKDFPELEAAFKEFTTFKNNLIDAGVDAGRFSKEQAAEWKEAADYVPWNRIKDYEDKIATSPQAYFRGLTNLKQMKEIRGGTEEINDIFDNMVGLSFWLVNGAIRNHAAVQLTDAFVANGLGARQVRQGQPGVDPNKTIYIYRDGKPEVYEYESMADVYAFKGVESMGGPLLSSFTAFANILRRTTTATPQFAASQLFQDAYRATVTSGVKNPFEVAAKVLTGAVGAYRGDATTQQLEKFGIVGAYDLMPGRAKDEIEKEFGIRQRSVLEKGLSFMESFSIASDASLRKAVFEQTLEETKSPQFPDGDVLLARYRAQEVINFKRQGANRTVGLMRQLIPFMNAYIQGMDVFYRTMTGRGVAATERSEAFKMFLGTGVKLATLATIYTMLVGGDDEYEGLRDYEKDKNFIVPGTGVKIPVAPEVGFFFKVIPERMYNYVASQGTERPQDAAALRKAIGTAAFDAFSGPNLTPQAVKPALELLVNYSFFTGTPIVGRGLEKLEPAQQFTDSTSEIAKMIGGLAGISPMKLEYFVRGTTGIAGGTVLDLSNMLFTDRPDKRLYEMPAFKTFMYDKIPGGYKEQYYDLREKVEQVVYTMNGLKAQGRAEELQEYLNDDRINLLALRRSMNQIDQQLEKMRAFRKLISNDPTMTGAEKKDRLDEIERTENELLRAYNIPALRKEVAGL